MLLEYILLADMIKEKSKNAPVVYCPNYGNWGDGLIHYATLAFLRHFGIQFVVRNRFNLAESADLKPKESKLLLYGGAGSWRGLGGAQSQLLPNCAAPFDSVFVLPASYGADFGAHFAQIPAAENPISLDKITFFARDEFSSLTFNPTAIFCHDMAFFLGNIDGGIGSGVGNFFRKDGESARRIEIPDDNVDISEFGKVFTPIHGFFDAISKFQTIRTDRLHVCVAAALLDKDVELYSGAYFKNPDIFKSSIEGRYPKVKFMQFS